MQYLYILRQALVYITVLFWLYELAISLCSLIKFKEALEKVVNHGHGGVIAVII